MPGICGYLDFRNTFDNKPYFEIAVRNTIHYSNYEIELRYENCHGSALVKLPNENLSSIFSSDGIIVSFYGDLYSFDGHNNIIYYSEPSYLIHELYKIKKDITKIVNNLNGDFNCSIYDKKNSKLYLFNDRFGLRPLYCFYGQSFLYSHEIKFFQEFPFFNKEVDWQSVTDYFRYSYVFGDKTLYRDVRLLPPASYLVVDSSGVHENQYWYPRYTEERSLNDLPEAIDTGLACFKTSIERRVGSSKNILIYLTGGLDSRLISAVTSELDVNITTATLGSVYSYEYTLAKKVSNRLGLGSPKHFAINYDWLANYFEEIVWNSEAQYGSFQIAWQNGINRCVGSEYDCLLNGLFGGHLSFGSPYFNDSDVDNARSLDEQVQRIDRGFNGHLYPRVAKYLTNQAKDMVQLYGYATLKEEMQRAEKQSDKVHYRQDALFLYNRIRRGMIGIDQNYFFFRDQYPFASYELFDFYTSLDTSLLLDHRLYKEIYKKHFPDLARIPWWTTGADLYGCSNKFNNFLRNFCVKFSWYAGRLSIGHIVLTHPWTVRYEYNAPRKSQKLRTLINTILASDQCRQRNLYNRAAVDKLLVDCMKGKASMDTVGILVMLEMWFQLFVDGESCLRRPATFDAAQSKKRRMKVLGIIGDYGIL